MTKTTKDTVFWREGNQSKFTKRVGNDIIEIDEKSGVGVYIYVTMNFGPWRCKEMLYAVSRDIAEFWICSRDWEGPPPKNGRKFARDVVYPVGIQVRLNDVPAVVSTNS